MITLKINDKEVKVEEGTKLIEAIEKSGYKVPTLCYYKYLSPYGACRLCIVEIHIPGKNPTIQASCSYPVTQELEVFTDSERVKRARKITIELLFAMCPDSEKIRRLAEEYGIKEPRIKKKNEDCILCGLCVRICKERMGRSAVGFIGRGPSKKITSPFNKENPQCWVCGACEFICPVGKSITKMTTSSIPIPIQNEYNKGLNERPAVYILYPQTVPNKPVIDKNTCLHLNYGVCGICEEVCEVKAIDYTQKEHEKELEVGAILLTPGCSTFNPELIPEYGYKKLKNVITSIEFERMLSPSGPFAGKVKRLSDGKEPRKIAFIQCVGSREAKRDYCSAVCCMYATKEAIIAKEHVGEELKCDIFYMDVRAFGKGFEEYYKKAKEMGVNYIRCRIPRIKENSHNKNPVIEYINEKGEKVSKEYDLVVLSVGIIPPEKIEKLSRKIDLPLNELGFCELSPFEPVKVDTEGIYAAGILTEPKDIPDSVTQGSAAAAEILEILKEAKWELTEKKEYPPERDVSSEKPRIGVFVCHCGTNIASVVNIPEVVEYVKNLPDVVYAENNLYTCSTDTQERIKEIINKYKLNRIVVASCTPRTHEPLFQNTLKEAGLNPYLFEMANIREHCAWVHPDDKKKATEKAKDLIRMAIAKARLLEPLETKFLEIKKSALVIGGGVSGMISAISLANQGYVVYLIEKEKELGGNLRKIYYLLNGEEPQKFLKDLILKVENNDKIKVFKETEIKEVEGSVGNFKTKISHKGEEIELEHGIAVIAVGAKEYKPEEYYYKEDERVLTQLELEERIGKNGDFLIGNKIPQNVVMIQCVGSRNEKRKYCSRICCSHAIKNAIKIKEISPNTNVFVLYRDIRTYGFREKYYTKARQMGVVFIRYEEGKNPEIIRRDKNGFILEVYNPDLSMKIQIPADLIVLSTAIIPDIEENEKISKLFKVPLTQDKFFLEAHMKLRPVDFATDGVFLAGLAHYPKEVGESIVQAKAAAARASVILSKDYLELDAKISFVVDENCDGCAYCVDTCPYDALVLLEYIWKDSIKKTVENNESICKGCGTCMATCPKKGIYVKGFKLEQIEAQIEALLTGG